MGNYVIEVGNSVIATPSELGNYMIADTRDRFFALPPTLPDLGRRLPQYLPVTPMTRTILSSTPLTPIGDVDGVDDRFSSGQWRR
jgi:hypothetical protein